MRAGSSQFGMDCLGNIVCCSAGQHVDQAVFQSPPFRFTALILKLDKERASVITLPSHRHQRATNSSASARLKFPA